MRTLTAIAIITILVIIVVYYISFYKSTGSLPSAPFSGLKNAASKTYDEYFAGPESLYHKTVGHVNNDTTKMAVTKARKKEKMNKRNEKFADISDKNMNEATTNAFILGDLLRFNVAPNTENREDIRQEAANAYQNVLNRVTRNPDAVIAGHHDNLPAPEYMVDRIEDFYENYIAQAVFDFDTNRFDQARDNLRHARVRAATQPRLVGVRKIKKRVKSNASDKQKHQDAYFEERAVGNDPQNVHESEITNQMRNIYKLVAQENKKLNDTHNIKQIKQAVKGHEFETPEKRKRALKALNIIQGGHWVSSLNDREDKVLLNVWTRIHDPRNKENKDSLKTALMDSLAECVAPDYYGVDQSVCTMGRTERVINSLTLLDSDEDISKPVKTKEIMRNEVFTKSYKIIQDELKKMPTEVVRAYNGVTSPDEQGPDLQESVKTFEQMLKDKIADDVVNTYPSAKQDTIEQLIKDAQAGV